MNVRAMGSVMGCAAMMATSGAGADVRLPAVLTSNMVVQADADVKFWGWADAGELVRVTADWMPKAATVKADEKGRWSVGVRSPGYGKGVDAFAPHRITIQGAGNTIVLENVLVGEVWVCSGQSNMEMPVGDKGGGYRGVDNWEKEAAAATVKGVRLFMVENAVSATPVDDCIATSLGGERAGWVECSPTTVVDFSGTGYFFGRELREKLNVPIGLIASDWGGTPAEAWTSEKGLTTFPEYNETVEWMKQRAAGRGDDVVEGWWSDVVAADRKVLGMDAAAVEVDEANWGMMRVPGAMAGDLESFDGAAWFRRRVELLPAWEGKDVAVLLGPIDDMDAVYFNGERVGLTIGSGKWYIPRRYVIPGRLVRKGLNTIAVQVVDVSGPGGMTGEAGQYKMELAEGGSASVGLDGYWKYRAGATLAQLPAFRGGRELNAHTPTALFNGMIAPLKNFAVRGAIWYQGESNRGRAEQYAKLMPAMISDWREAWGRSADEFPFLLVQIAPFTYSGDNGETAQLRESQRRTLALANTGMAVTMDIGNPTDIHPSNKQDVGKRLARWALAKTYARSEIEYSGPVAAGATMRDGSAGGVRVRFEHAKGLMSRGDLAHFEVAGADGRFVPARAVVDGEEVIVKADGVTTPASVRYGWCDACGLSLFNGAGLPASPFMMEVSR